MGSVNFRDRVIRANASNSGGSEVNYFLTDHSGSIKVIVDGNDIVKEVMITTTSTRLIIKDIDRNIATTDTNLNF